MGKEAMRARSVLILMICCGGGSVTPRHRFCQAASTGYRARQT